MEVPSISGSSSSKRARAPGSNTMSNSQVGNCSVDGCNADLSLCRDYHRRHKVCETHSKTAKVAIGGREQRFCQQCSRFHSLVEFDEGKRSCRKRLDGHNRRRRKPQPDSLPKNSSVVDNNIFSTQHASVPADTLLSFSRPQSWHPTSSSSWGGLVRPDNNNNDMLLYNNNNNNNDHRKPLSYMESRNSFPEHDYSQLQLLRSSQPACIVDHNATSHGLINQKNINMFSDSGLNQVVDSDHALSLLSSATPVTREFGLVQQPQPVRMPLAHNMDYFGNLHDQSSFLGQESKPPLVPATDSHGNQASNPHFSDMFEHVPPQGSSTSGSNQTLTFMWE